MSKCQSCNETIHPKSRCRVCDEPALWYGGLIGVSFPDCSHRCTTIAAGFMVLGDECEKVCPWKFDTDGQPIKKETER